MNEVENILHQFEGITLKEMDSVKLMNRTDTKFIFRIEQLPQILDEVKNSYFVLDVKGLRASRYKTLYYDTEDFQMYLQHQNKRLNRNKIRYREYVESSLNFFEIKFKSNKDRTQKERIKREAIETEITGKASEFLQKKTKFEAQNLVPKLWIDYTRITLVNKSESERLTIDLGLQFYNEERREGLPEIVIAELKQERRSNTAFIDVMRKHHIRTASISKYCFGIMFIYNNIKKNNFKPKLLTLNKIRYGTV